MNNTRLYQVLSSFSRVELNRFRKFIYSPYHNSHKEVRDLYDSIRAYLLQSPENKLDQLVKEKVFEVIFPGKPYDDLKFRHLNSYLMEVTREFLILEEIKSAAVSKDPYLIRAFNKKGLSTMVDSEFKRAWKHQSKSRIKDHHFHYDNIQLYREAFNLDMERRENAMPTIHKFTQELDLYFISNKLQVACSLLSLERMYTGRIELGMLKEILAYVEAQDLTTVPAIGVYYDVYQMLTQTQSDVHFANLKEKLVRYSANFSAYDLRTLYLYAINFCIGRINTGDERFVNEILDLYKNALETHVLLDQDKLSPFTYKNITSAALKAGDLEWAEEFIQQYGPLLPEEYQESFRSYNLARIYMVQQRYGEVVKILFQLHIKDTFTNLDAKVMLIKAYFELEDFRALEGQLENFRKFLKRKEMLSYHRQNYLNFLKYVQQMIRLSSFDSKKVKLLQKRIESEEVLADRDWLLARLNK